MQLRAATVSLAQLVPFVLAGAIAAQSGSPTFVPKDGAFVRIVVEDAPALFAAVPNTALGRLLAEPDVDEALTTFFTRVRERNARADAVIAAAKALGVATSDALPGAFVRQVDARDVQRFEMAALPAPEGTRFPGTVVLIGCVPKAEGGLTPAFEALAETLVGPNRVAVPDAKIGGVPAHIVQAADEADANDPDAEMRAALRQPPQWLLHVPGTFVIGMGNPDQCGTVAPPPARGAAGASIAVDVNAYIDMLTGFGGGTPTQELETIGVDRLARVEWRQRFAGEQVLDELEVAFSAEPRGLIGALLRGKAKLPAQPLPEGALLQLRCAVDVPAVMQLASEMPNAEHVLPEKARKAIAAALDGGLAIGVAAPARGGVIPRMFLSLGVADQKALDEVLAMIVRRLGKQVEYEGHACTVVTIPGAPPALQPAFTVIDGVLHAAESGTSLRAFLKARANGGDAMNVGDAPLPPGADKALPTFDLRSDAGATYRAMYDVWLPLLELLQNSSVFGGDTPVLTRDDMPSPDVVEKHLGKSRGVLVEDGGKFTLRHTGTLGGPVAATLAMAWGPMASASMHQGPSEYLLAEIRQKKLEGVGEALEAHRDQKGGLPPTLGELIVAGKLADDALLVPGDELAEDVVMPAGSDRKVKSSFRYFPATTKVDLHGEAITAVLITIAPVRYNRSALTDDGTVVAIWGKDASRPIDEFK